MSAETVSSCDTRLSAAPLPIGPLFKPLAKTKDHPRPREHRPRLELNVWVTRLMYGVMHLLCLVRVLLFGQLTSASPAIPNPQIASESSSVCLSPSYRPL